MKEPHVQTYHVAIVCEDGAHMSHSGLIRDHATAIYAAACLQPQTCYAHVATWYYVGQTKVAWQRLAHYTREADIQ